jgi:hypothetical protein
MFTRTKAAYSRPTAPSRCRLPPDCTRRHSPVSFKTSSTGLLLPGVFQSWLSPVCLVGLLVVEACGGQGASVIGHDVDQVQGLASCSGKYKGAYAGFRLLMLLLFEIGYSVVQGDAVQYACCCSVAEAIMLIRFDVVPATPRIMPGAQAGWSGSCVLLLSSIALPLHTAADATSRNCYPVRTHAACTMEAASSPHHNITSSQLVKNPAAG